MQVFIYYKFTLHVGRPSHPSSGVQKTVTAAFGTGHSNGATAFLRSGLIAASGTGHSNGATTLLQCGL